MVAGEGWPWLISLVICELLAAYYWGLLWASPLAVLCVLLFLLFRDPGRDIPPMPLAVVAPIDGRIVEISPQTDDTLSGTWTRISIKTNHFGAYTVRSPIEGTVLDVRGEMRTANLARVPSGLWVRSEENDDVVLLFPGGGLFAPKAFVRYGERVGQGQRFAYLRLAARAEVYLPQTAELCVKKGDRVRAGTVILAELAPQ